VTISTSMPQADVLSRVPLLASLDHDELEQLAAAATVLEYLPGELLLDEGGESRDLWILLAGRCKVVKQGESGPVELTTLEAFDHFGEMSFFHAAPHSASVRAVTEVKVLRLDRDRFDGMLADRSLAAFKLAYNAVDRLAQRLRRMDQWVAELLAADAQERPVRELMKFHDTLFCRWTL